MRSLEKKRFYMILLQLLLLRASFAAPVYEGVITVLRPEYNEFTPLAGVEEKQYHLKANNKLYNLRLQGEDDTLRTGDRVIVAARAGNRKLLTSDSLDTLEVLSVNVTDRSRDIAVTRVTSIVFLLNICNRSSGVSYERFRSSWYDSYAVNGQPTMQGYYSKCSQGYTSFLQNDNYIVPTEIVVPCTGPVFQSSFDSSKCGLNEVYGWANYASDYASNVLNIDLTKYSRRIMVVPNMNQCPWAGLGSVGCGGYCFTWLNGPYSLSLDTVFHELGHNLGLQHSTTPGQEYGDASCAMGAGGGLRCFNAPQNWLLGWAKPIATLNASSISLNKWIGYNIPAQTTTINNMVRVVADWTTHEPVVFYISFKSNVNYDIGLLNMYVNTVDVHIYNNTDNSRGSPLKPELQVLLKTGMSWNSAAYNFAVHVNSIKGLTASVNVCRYSNSVTDCKDGSVQGAVCGNGVCETPQESFTICPQDCPAVCGNLVCESPNESYSNCPTDCSPICGNGLCESPAETFMTCPTECRPICGNAVCESPNETYLNCPSDCKTSCGNRVCESPYENYTNCAKDCKPVCGNNICESPYETHVTCPHDCPLPPSPPNPRSPSPSPRSPSPSPSPPSPPKTRSPPPRSPSPPTNVCGNGHCEPPKENLRTCPIDCNPVCGNGICELGEDRTRCPRDCM